MITSSGSSLMVSMIVFTVLITLSVGLRFWAAKVKKRELRIDDWLIVFAWLSTVTDEATTFWAIPNGLGAHQADLTFEQIGIQYQNLTAISFTWLFATVAIKMSILCFYLVIFPTPKFKIMVYVMLAVCVGYLITFMTFFLTQCTPISQSWNPVPGGKCRNLDIEELSSVALNMLIDIIIVGLPMPTLWKLQMGIQNKLIITFMFCMGLIVTAIMAWRLQITTESETLTDVTFGLGDVCLVSSLELWVGIIAACMPTLAPLYMQYIRPVVTTYYTNPKKAKQNSPREATATIGGSRRKSYLKKGSKMDTDNYLELEEGRYLAETDARRASDSTTNHATEWSKGPNEIEVRQEYSVARTAKRDMV